MADSKIKDVSPDDIYYMTWLIQCIEYDNIGEPYLPVYHDTISQDYYIPDADYVLIQKANDSQMISQIERLWASAHHDRPEVYSILSEYLKELAMKFVHKQCVRHGSQNIHSYFEDWIDHTKDLLSVEGDRLSYIVYNYDIDELVKIIRTNLKLFSMILYKPTDSGSAQSLKIRLKDFFAQEQNESISPAITPERAQKEVQFISTKNEQFTSELSPYKFTELEKVKCLNQYQQRRLIELIVEYDTPSAVAMLYFLDLPKKLKTEYGKNKEKQYHIVAKSLGVSERTVKGNFLTVTNTDSKEDQYKYPACDKLEKIKNDYNDILINN